MTDFDPPGDAVAALVAWAAALVVATGVVAPVQAGEPAGEQRAQPPPLTQQDPDPFNGSFREWSARGGIAGPSEGSLGWVVDVGFRHAFPMYLGDSRVAYQFSRWSVDDQPVDVHGLHLTMGVHPFYLALLSEGPISHALASFHIEFGVGPRYARGDGDDTFGLAGGLGIGFDLPLTDPNVGQALWFNTVYRRNWSTATLDIEGESRPLHDHLLFVGLAWRINGTLWD